MKAATISLVLLLLTGSVQARIWTASSGKGQVEAKYLGFEDGKVKLHHGASGRVLLVPLRALVAADHEFVRQQMARQPSNTEVAQGIDAPLTPSLRNEPASAKHYLTRGRARIRKADYLGAINDFSQAIELDPRDATAYNGRGLAYQRKGDLTSAQCDFDTAIKLDQNYAAAYRNRAENLSKLAMDEGQISPQLDEEIERQQRSWNRSRERNLSNTPWQPLPTNSSRLNRQAILRKMAEADQQRAEQLEENETAEDQGLPNHDGDAQPKSGDQRPPCPSSVCPYCGRSDDNGDRMPSTRGTHSWEGEERDAATLTRLAEAYVEEGRYDRAVELYSRLLDRDPENTRYLRARASANAQLGGYESARRDYDQLVEIEDKPDATLHYNRGCAHLAASRLPEAIDDFTESIKLKENWSIAYNNRGSALARQGHYRKAIEDFTKAIEYEPANRLAYRNRALAYKKLGEKGKAQTDFDIFLNLKQRGRAGSTELSRSSQRPDLSHRLTSTLDTASSAKRVLKNE